jgi:hypothetical protein
MLGPDPKLQLLDRRQQGSLIRQTWDEQGLAMASGTEAASTSVQHPSLEATVARALIELALGILQAATER